MISPVFETLAQEKGGREGVAFTKIDLGAGLGGSVASEWAVRVTPTFLFFLDGKKVGCASLACSDAEFVLMPDTRTERSQCL
jgi:hypothetical protein